MTTYPSRTSQRELGICIAVFQVFPDVRNGPRIERTAEKGSGLYNDTDMCHQWRVSQLLVRSS